MLWIETLISVLTEETKLYLFNAYEPFNCNFVLLVIEKDVSHHDKPDLLWTRLCATIAYDPCLLESERCRVLKWAYYYHYYLVSYSACQTDSAADRAYDVKSSSSRAGQNTYPGTAFL